MKLSNVLLGALLLGIAVETSSCNKCDDKDVIPQANDGQVDNNQNHNPPLDDCCPACGRG